ncbi:MAG: glycerophosphodiester phosphodiesterase family protein [Bacillota bacterium]|nr:glycerophosphodiester phosphodiesterase family protein [Bacillota bacterium]
MNIFAVIGHRGACAYAPENTQASFKIAYDMGVDSIETDIRCTCDGVLVLCHDALVDRTSNGRGPVEKHTYEQLLTLDFGSWFSPRFANERIVTLDEFLSDYGGKVHLVLEIKADRLEDKIVDLIESHHLNRDDYTVISFKLDRIMGVINRIPSVRAGYLIKEFNDQTISCCVDHHIPQICPRADILDVDTIKKAHDNNLDIRAWGVKDITMMKHVVDLGTDGMTVDFPDVLLDYLKERVL